MCDRFEAHRMHCTITTPTNSLTVYNGPDYYSQVGKYHYFVGIDSLQVPPHLLTLGNP